MRLLLAIAIIVATSNVVAAEKPKDTPPKEQWIEITKPIMGCSSEWFATVNPLITPLMVQALDSKAAYRAGWFDCAPITIGEKFILDKPTAGYTTLISVVCGHCAPQRYPSYTTEKTGFYKLIPAPIDGTSF